MHFCYSKANIQNQTLTWIKCRFKKQKTISPSKKPCLAHKVTLIFFQETKSNPKFIATSVIYQRKVTEMDQNFSSAFELIGVKKPDRERQEKTYYTTKNKYRKHLAV